MGDMDRVLVNNLMEVDADPNNHIFHCGDLAFNANNLNRVGLWFQNPQNHTILAGNHDRLPKQKEQYDYRFGTIIGTMQTWLTNTLIVDDELNGSPIRLLLSHFPQLDLQGCDFNIHGHTHTELVTNTYFLEQERAMEVGISPEEWMRKAELHKYLNVCVEHTNYRPVTLEELVAIHGR